MEVIKGNNDTADYTIGIVVARWNSFVTNKLAESAFDLLKNKGFREEQIIVVQCPGAFEIPFAARTLLPKVDGIITLGAVIRGETPHFKYVCQAVTEGVLRLNIECEKPVMFGVLTTDTVQQANERADQNSDFGNKGAEAALALLEMMSLSQKIRNL